MPFLRGASDIPNRARNNFQRFFKDERTNRLKLFLTYIFDLYPADHLYNYIKLLVNTNAIVDDTYIYQKVQAFVKNSGLNTVGYIWPNLRLLRRQRQVLGQQTKRLLSNKIGSVQGYLTVGDNGRYINCIRKHIDISGPIYVLGQKGNFVETGGLWDCKTIDLSYDDFCSLNLQVNSLELVTIYVGLHHFSLQSLERFLLELYKVMKPGAYLIIREHDAESVDDPFLHIAHSIFNAVTNVSLEDEQLELRHFNTIAKWRELLAGHGFVCNNDMYQQYNDPTLNKLMLFECVKDVTKSSNNECNYVQSVQMRQGYSKPLEQTYQTVPEWFSVDVVKKYSEYLTHTPWYQFPYFKVLWTFWWLWLNQLITIKQKLGLAATLSAYSLMNFVIGLVLTIVFFQLSFLAVIPRLMYGTDEYDNENRIQAVIECNSDPILIDSRIKILEHRAPYYFVDFPKFMPFTEIISKLAKIDAIVHDLAGHNKVLVGVKIVGSLDWTGLDCVSLHQKYELVDETNYVFNVLVRDLCKVVLLLESQGRVHIYEY